MNSENQNDDTHIHSLYISVHSYVNKLITVIFHKGKQLTGVCNLPNSKLQQQLTCSCLNLLEYINNKHVCYHFDSHCFNM